MGWKNDQYKNIFQSFRPTHCSAENSVVFGKETICGENCLKGTTENGKKEDGERER